MSVSAVGLAVRDMTAKCHAGASVSRGRYRA
jgi:hypothetical protein